MAVTELTPHNLAVLDNESFCKEHTDQCDIPRDVFYAVQKSLRFDVKPYGERLSDAIFADLDARDIEFETDPREEAVDYVNSWILAAFYELDDPWYFPEAIYLQFALFDQLDREQKLTVREPKTDNIVIPIEDTTLHAVLAEFLTRDDVPKDLGTVEELMEHYRMRMAQITEHGAARIRRIRGE